jgi:lipopolysaccharide export system protein LptA
MKPIGPTMRLACGKRNLQSAAAGRGRGTPSADGQRPRAPRPAALAAALVAVLAALLPAAVLAERADRDKEAKVTADHSTLDDLHQVQVLTGHVLLTKGTMRMSGERMEHRQDEQGYQYYVVTAAPGELATFHERRDPVREGVESTIDGFGEQIEYDDRTDRVILLRRALVKRFENGEQRDQLSGSRIVYDARKSNYDVDGRSADGTGKVHITIAPRAAAGPPKAAPGAPPSAAPNLQVERTPPEGAK